MHPASGLAPDPDVDPAPIPHAQHHPGNDSPERQRLDEATRCLDEAQARLDLITGIVGIWVWRHDLRTDRVHYDDSAWRIFGLPPRDDGWPLAKVRERVHPDDLPAVRASARRTLADGCSTDVEARYLHTDGTWHYVLTRRTLQRDDEGNPVAFVGVSLDVNDRVEESRRSLDLARRLDATARAAGIGLWSMNVYGGASEWNAKMFELFGLPQGPRPPRFADLLRQVIHPEDRSRVRRDSYRWIHQGERAFEVEYRVVLPDGDVRWLLNRCDVDRAAGRRRLYGVTMDVTERRRTEAALQRANERIALAAHGAGIGTWERDLASGERFWDEQMFALRGLEPQCTPPSDGEWLENIHPDDRRRVLDSLARSVETGEPVTYDYRVERPDGQWRWLASRVQTLRDADGRVMRQTGVNWDVTEARLNEAERQERLAAQRESRAKSQFLARMSHELRTPLNAVLGFTQLMLAEDDLPDAQRDRVARVNAAGEHLLSLINDVLDLSSVESGEMRMQLGPVELEAAVRETLPLMEGDAHRRRIALQCAALDEVVWADATRLRQVLLNLLSNAIKYNVEGGRVVIEASSNGAAVRLAVHDTGRGLQPAQLAHLFEPFNRLGIEGEGIEGTGIGLAVVKSIVGAMGGRVWATSEPGVGSTFTVQLEDARHAVRAAATGLPTLMPAAVPATCQGTLLYIEDNPVNVMIVEELITHCPGITLASEPDGTRGVQRARELQPDLVLADMQLPDMDGHEVLRRLRAEPATARIPCIALSANAMPEDISRALAAGFADYWTKPIDFRAFTESLRTLFGSR